MGVTSLSSVERMNIVVNEIVAKIEKAKGPFAANKLDIGMNKRKRGDDDPLWGVVCAKK